MNRRAEHVVMGNDSVRCTRCGAEYKFTAPISINVLLGLSDGFLEDHKRCADREITPEAESRFEYTSPEEWARSWDTGLSSMTIFKFMKSGHVARPEVPHDADDLGRCIRLLRVAPPSWRGQGMTSLARAYPMWAKLVANWTALESLYEKLEEDLDSESAAQYGRKIYDLIQWCIR